MVVGIKDAARLLGISIISRPFQVLCKRLKLI